MTSTKPAAPRYEMRITCTVNAKGEARETFEVWDAWRGTAVRTAKGRVECRRIVADYNRTYGSDSDWASFTQAD